MNKKEGAISMPPLFLFDWYLRQELSSCSLSMDELIDLDPDCVEDTPEYIEEYLRYEERERAKINCTLYNVLTSKDTHLLIVESNFSHGYTVSTLKRIATDRGLFERKQPTSDSLLLIVVDGLSPLVLAQIIFQALECYSAIGISTKQNSEFIVSIVQENSNHYIGQKFKVRYS